MKIDTQYRSTAPEIMDDFLMEGPVLTDALDKIAAINRLLEGNKVTLTGIEFLLTKTDTAGQIKITDIGCGNGAMLRMLAEYSLENSLNFQLVGVDANQATITHAASLSKAYPNITYQCSDIFDEETHMACDIMLFTLTLHHFTDKQIIGLLKNLKKTVSVGIVVNDLERSSLAYRLFKMLCYVFKLNDMSREDGLVSILRGFKRGDLLRYEKELGIGTGYIQWKWAFRYLWIIKTQ